PGAAGSWLVARQSIPHRSEAYASNLQGQKSSLERRSSPAGSRGGRRDLAHRRQSRGRTGVATGSPAHATQADSVLEGIERILSIEPVLVPSQKIPFRARRLNALAGNHPDIASLWPGNDQVPVSGTPIVTDINAAMANLFAGPLVSLLANIPNP